MDRSGEKVLQVDHDGGLAMISVMTSTMTGEVMAIDNGNDGNHNDRGERHLP